MENREYQIILFGTEHDGDMKREYKELADIEEFKDLNTKEVKFCWLVGNRTSPIFKIERDFRIQKALKIVWGDKFKLNPKIKELSKVKTSDELPDDILKGIMKMNTFNPGLRLRAKLINEYIFDTLNELIMLDEGTKSTMDVDEKKKYTDLVIKVGSELQGMVDRLENSYGIEVIDRKTKEEVQVSIEDVMH